MSGKDSQTDFNKVLQTLHRMHRQFADLMDRLNRGPRKVKAAEMRAAELQSEQEAAVRRVIDLRIATDEKQAQLEKNEQNIARRKQQLLEAKDNREYAALRDQIAADEAANAVLADEILEALDRMDDLKAAGDKAKAACALGYSQLEKIRADVASEKETVENEIRRIKVDFSEVESELEDEFLTTYKRIFGAKKFDSLALVEGTSCQGCHTKVTLNQITMMAENRQPVLCASCGRLIYLPENYHV
ncbi:MAG: hypothetical protein Q4D38_02625 [Planctomycetia bacterium]|nr:hypothetical protein [Planctomycetia bacterium]